MITRTKPRIKPPQVIANNQVHFGSWNESGGTRWTLKAVCGEEKIENWNADAEVDCARCLEIR